MNIKIVLCKKIKEKAFNEAIDEYAKRLSRFCKLEVLCEPPENPVKIQVNDKTYIIEVSIRGHLITSTDFARHLGEVTLRGKSDIVFLLNESGETLPVSSHFSMSLSKLDVEYRLLSVLLMEQVYRAFKINSGETYHK